MKSQNMVLVAGLIGFAEMIPPRYKRDSDLRSAIKPKDKATKRRRAKNKTAAKSRVKNR